MVTVGGGLEVRNLGGVVREEVGTARGLFRGEVSHAFADKISAKICGDAALLVHEITNIQE